MLSSSVGQYEYIELILLAVAVGILAACGNLRFRLLIDFASWVFLKIEWNALGIGHGLSRALIPLILLSGGVCILVLDYLFPGDVLGYGFPNFLEMVNLGNARIRQRWIFVKGAGAALSLGSGASVGHEGDRTDRRGYRLGRCPNPASLYRSSQGSGRRGRRSRYRHHLQRPDGRSDVRAGNYPAGTYRDREPNASSDLALAPSSPPAP